MTLYNENKKRELIMEYYLNPKFKIITPNKNLESIYLHSSSCVDEITLFYDLKNNKYEYIAKGCAVFLSSVEIFIERIISLRLEEQQKIMNSYYKLLNKENISNEDYIFLDKLTIFENVKKHLNRLECALMIYYAFQKILIST